MKYEIINHFTDKDGRIVLLNIQINDTIFSIVCLYGPNNTTARKSFFKKVDLFVKENGIGIPIIGGDFNETLKNIDRISPSNNHKNNKPVSSLKSLLKDNNLIDIWRVMNENIQQFTWRRKDKSQASRIDLILIDSNLRPQIDTCKIKPATIQYTDHLSVCLTFKTGASEKGRGFWKLNNSVLENKDYQSLINKLTF